MAYYDQGCCNPCNYKPSCCSPCSCPPSCGSSSCCNPRSCGCQGSSAPNQPSYICANGYMNDYARCALARYDQLSYDLDSLPVLPCNPSCYPCGSCCGCPYPCPPTTPAPNPNPCPNAPSYLNAVNDPEQTVASGSPVLFATDRGSSGNCIQHTAGTSNFTLNCPGVYLVEYNANASVAGGTNVAVSLSLLSGGVIVPGTQSAETVDATSQTASLSASTIITVPCGTTGSIALSNTSAGSVNLTNANIRIVRVL